MNENQEQENEEVSRRKFLKTLATGSVTLGALAAIPSASALSLNTNDLSNTGKNISLKSSGFNFLGGGSNSPDFRIDSNGNLIVKGNIDMNQNQAQNMVLHKVNGDPSSPAVGQIWYDTSAD